MYAQSGNTAFQDQSVTRVPELGRLKSAAERIAAAAASIDGFLYRFDGPRPIGGDTTAAQPPESYRNDLDTLFVQIMRLEDAASALDALG